LGWIVDKLIANESFLNGAIKIGNKLGKFLTNVLPPAIDAVFAFIEKASPFVVGVGSFLVDSLFWTIDTADAAYNGIRNFTRDQFGEEGVKKLDQFTGILNKFIDGIIIFATAASLADGGGPPPPPGPDKPPKGGKPGTGTGSRPGGPPGRPGRPSPISRYLSQDAKSLSNLRKFGPAGQTVWNNAFASALSDGKTPTQSRIYAQNQLQRLVNQNKITPKPLPTLAGGAGTPSGGILNRGFQRSFNRFGLKVLGRGGLQAVKQFAGRVPIAGPIISAVASLLGGEPISQALVRASGSAIGGFIGAGLTGPLAPLGGILGSLVGEFLANTLYEIVTGQADQKIRSVATAAIKTAAMQLSGDLKKITDVIVGVFSLIKDPAKVLQVLGNVIRSVAKGATTVVNFLLDIVKSLPGGMQAIQLIAKAQRAASDAGKVLTELTQRGADAITSPIKSAASFVASGLAEGARRGTQVLTSQIDNAKTAVKPVTDFFGNVARGFNEKVTQATQFFAEKYKQLIEQGKKIAQKSAELGQNLKRFAGNISEGAKNYILENIIGPIKSKIKPLVEQAKGMGNKVKGFITENPLAKKLSGALQKKGVKGFGDIGGIMKAVGAKGLTVIGGLFNLLFASDRLKSGDTSGGILEGLSGILDLSTLFGNAAGGPLSLTLDAYLLVRDLVPEVMNEEKYLFNNIPGFKQLQPGITAVAQNLPSFDSILQKFGGDNPQVKNLGGIVGYNAGGIVGGGNYNVGGMVGENRSYTSRKSPKKSQVNMVRYSASNSSRYDTKKFDRSMSYDDGYIEHTKVIVLVKPAVAV
jgi:hypothetical protein